MASVCMGLAVAALLYWFVRVMTYVDATTDNEWRYDTTRIRELRRQDALYRGAQPLIRLFARFNRGVFSNTLVDMRRELQAAGLPRYWLPEEYLGRCELVALLWLPVYIVVCWRFMGPPGLVLALTLTAATAWFCRARLRRKARTRLAQIKRRLPFFLDLLTLLMEAGSTFVQGLADAVHEFARQPIAVEFGRVLTDINLGKARTEAFEALRNRLDDNDITSLIGAIIQGENLGTPVAAVFRTQADVMRIKRTQSAETVAGEAGVNMLFPGVLVMMAAVALILGPFLLNYLYFGLQM
ncbi:MAG TPA: type II secretion system F family protein [Pirellulales bacterium]|nr:type II secretion system F family protein [Pirellulales bacterium]